MLPKLQAACGIAGLWMATSLMPELEQEVPGRTATARDGDVCPGGARNGIRSPGHPSGAWQVPGADIRRPCPWPLEFALFSGAGQV